MQSVWRSLRRMNASTRPGWLLPLSFLLVTPCAAQRPEATVVVHEDLQYGAHGRQGCLDLFVPAADAPPPVVMFVHGGSWTFGDKRQFAAIGDALAGEGFACAVVNTRQFPFARPRQMVRDCADALAFVRDHADEYGYDGDRLFVMGHSSGAHLASWLAFDQQLLADVSVPRSALKGAVLLSGVFDVRPRHPALDRVFGRDAERRRDASPLVHVDADDPPVFVASAERDIASLPLSARVLADRLRDVAVGVTERHYADRDHVDYFFELTKPGATSRRDVLAFLRAPQRAASANAPPRTVVWIATDDRERGVGEHVAQVLGVHGVEVLVLAAVEASGRAVAERFRELVRERRRLRLAAPTFVAGVAAGARAVAHAPLTREVDGLRGRMLFAAELPKNGAGLRWLRSGRRPSDLLLLHGDDDRLAARAVAGRLGAAFWRAGVVTDTIELAGTTAERALAALRADDDLLLPMLRAFVGR